MRRIRSLAMCAMSALMLAGCSVPETPVGSVVMSWSDPDDNNLLDLGDLAGETLLRDQAAWDAWVKNDLSQEMYDARSQQLRDYSLEDNVVVVEVWGRCTQTSRMMVKDGGTLEFQIIENQTACAWTPTYVDVWEIPLEDLNVAREDVRLSEQN